MMNGFQENAVALLALEHGRVSVHDGFEDNVVRATVPSGAEFRIGEDGVPHQCGINLSVDWSE